MVNKACKGLGISVRVPARKRATLKRGLTEENLMKGILLEARVGLREPNLNELHRHYTDITPKP